MTGKVVKRRTVLLGAGAVAMAGVGGAYSTTRKMGSMDEYNAYAAESRATISEHPDISDIVRYATLAASGHNTQPWQFLVARHRIDILPDFSRRTPVVDPDDHHLFASLGCAAENLSLAAAGRGRPGDIEFNPTKTGSIAFNFRNKSDKGSALFDAIPRRQSTRAEYDGKPISIADMKLLSSAASIPGVDLVLITDRPLRGRLRDLVLAGNQAQMADAAFVGELKQWLRFSPREAIRLGDGLFSVASGNPALPDWLGQRMFDVVFRAQASTDTYARQLDSSAGAAVFVAQQNNPEHWVLAGRSCQRFALQATALGLKTAFVNQPVEVARLRSELANLVGLPGRRPDIVMRFGYGPDLPQSPRRSVRDVMTAAAV